MVSSRRWHKGRFYHDLFSEPTSEQESTIEEGSAILRLRAIALLNDRAVEILKDGRTTLANNIFGEALTKTLKLTPDDANSIRCRNLVFSEILPARSDAATSYYLVPIHCEDDNNIFSKAILVCSSHLQASVNSLVDVLYYHLGLCRHIQASESTSMTRRQVLFSIAAKHYKKVARDGLARAAACRNLVSCSGASYLQEFMAAYECLQDSDEIAEFRDCLLQTAEAA